jgi:hypothetical protein
MPGVDRASNRNEKKGIFFEDEAKRRQAGLAKNITALCDPII